MNEKNELLEIYKIHVELIDRVSQRRGTLNQFYISLLSGLIGIIAFTVKDNALGKYEKTTFMVVGLLGIIISILWIAQIHSYKQINSAKFKVIDKIEEKLVFPFFREEWMVLKSKKRYNTLTNLEKIAPVILLILFVILFIYSFINH
ncbi:MAG: hypothetical protein H6577_05650 [Lewinellaceae bacterium]|nr:hypothetical protein [Lewinellaceae bacterium]